MVVKAQWLEGLETPYLWNVSELLLPRERTCLLYRLQDQVRNISHLTFDNFVIGLLLGYELFATAKDVATATSSLEVLEMDLFKMDIVSNCSFYREIRRAQWHTLLASRSVLLASIGKLAESRRVVEENFDPVTVFNSAEKAATLGIKSRAFLEYGPKAWSEALRLAKEAIMNNVNEPEWHFLAGKTLELS
ncbi:uncharacterized protein LOC128983530 isoform X2 [Macrosteles quadrilineatus]|uniref:uncharacterized protein LOC128983530 isoform X2 n=1 Tax=Macrosteles quadrilineatus TaxID=74068 RepID=UPI0023E1B6C6|nr:uncharacterized protein LOC128983530 isoform X2 [Macrosteles quadrilineatus]